MKTKKTLRWSQTPEGRKELSRMMKARHAARRRAALDVEVPVVGKALAVADASDVLNEDSMESAKNMLRAGYAVYGRVEAIIVERSKADAVPRRVLTEAVSKLLQDSADTL